MKNRVIHSNIIYGIVAGDYNMYSQLIDIYGDRILSFCYSFCKSREEAEELCQDVFIKIWQNRKTLDIDKNIDSFIYTIARNLCINHLKSAKNQYKIKKIFLEEELRAQNPSSENEVILKEYLIIAKEAVDRLPGKCKEVYVLSRIDGLKNKDIARRLGISVNTVRAQIVKSNAFIKNYLREKADLTISILLFIHYLVK